MAEAEAASKLSKEQRDLVQKWVDEKLKDKKPLCPMCQTGNWTLMPHFVELRTYAGGGISIGAGGAVYPLFALLCANCGYMATINAYAADVLPPEKKEGSSDVQ